MSTYFLGNLVLGGKRKKISHSRYIELKKIRERLKLILNIEDNYSILAQSYVEFEEHLLSLGLIYLYDPPNYAMRNRFSEQYRVGINLKVMTLLTAFKSYVDQSQRNLEKLNSMLDSGQSKASINLSGAFDLSLEYRVMDGLRNVAQHHSIPIGMFRLSSQNIYEDNSRDPDARSRLRTTVDPAIDVQDFLAAGKVRKKTRDEVRALGKDFLDLKFFVRGFVASICEAHIGFRKNVEATVTHDLAILSGASNEIRKLEGKAPIGLSIWCKVGDEMSGEVFVGYEGHAQILEIRQRWGNLHYVQRCCVSSELTLNRDTYPNSHSRILIG